MKVEKDRRFQALFPRHRDEGSHFRRASQISLGNLFMIIDAIVKNTLVNSNGTKNTSSVSPSRAVDSYVNFASDQMRTDIEIEKERTIDQFHENSVLFLVQKIGGDMMYEMCALGRYLCSNFAGHSLFAMKEG